MRCNRALKPPATETDVSRKIPSDYWSRLRERYDRHRSVLLSASSPCDHFFATRLFSSVRPPNAAQGWVGKPFASTPIRRRAFLRDIIAGMTDRYAVEF